MSTQLTLNDAAELLGLESFDVNLAITGAAIDSRRVKRGNLFVAIVGDHTDGHHYISEAREAGASVALVSTLQNDRLPQLVVSDVVKMFGKLAAYWRKQCNCKVVAVTGSNGKTTVKEMLAAILSQSHVAIATEGNLNNNLGVPLSLFRIQTDTDYAIIEMGANHAGEIAELVQLACPTVSLINNVSEVHIEGFGSIEGVVEAKSEIFSSLPSDGVGVFNADMNYSQYWNNVLKEQRSLSFGLNSSADVQATDYQSYVTSSHFMVRLDEVFHYINLPLPGSHNMCNALAAIAVSKALSINVEDMASGLNSVKSVPHRLQIRRGIKNATILDDSYNANPASYEQAIATLKTFPGEHWIVLGDFGELGDQSEEIHTDLGVKAKSVGIKRLLTIGNKSRSANISFGEGATHFSDLMSIQEYLESKLSKDITCLIKGSRFMKLEKLADELAIRREG